MRRPFVLALVACGLAVPLRADEGTGYVEMPLATDGSYTLASKPGSGHNWGRPEFIRFLVAVSREWQKRHPELPRVCIGDMSHKDGSDFPPHKTHKDGLTADIVTRPVNVCDVKYPNPEHQVELAEIFAAFGARQILFNGEAVVARVKVASKYENHDDHFHVVLDPKRLPEDGKPVVLPAGDLGDGSTIGGATYDGKHLLLRWHVLGGTNLVVKTVEATVDDLDDANGVLWSSGPQKPGKDASLKAPVALEDGKSYRWKLELALGSGEIGGFGWQKLTAELTPPELEPTTPDDLQVSSAPELAWNFAKKGSAQASFVVELSENGGKKVSLRVGPIAQKEGRFLLRATQLRKNQRYHWRVRATDAQGNAATSPWRSFKTTMDYRFVPPAAKATRTVTVGVAKLKKGDVVLVLGESEEKLIVRAERAKVEGIVERSAFSFD